MKNIIETLKANKHLTIAIISSFFLIGIIIFVLSAVKTSSESTSDNSITSTKDFADSELTSTTIQDTSEIESDTEPLTDSEPITDGNGNIISDINFTLPNDQNEEPETTRPSNDYPYLVKVNRLLNCVTVYAKDSSGEFTVPYKSMACSTGKYINNTPLGTFRTSSKYDWRLMVDGTHSQYATRVYGGILFHSVPCYSPSKDQLEVVEFNKLGGPASLGCIRLTVIDAKWIHDNCPYGTTVIIYDDANTPGPLGKPSVIKIPENSPYAGWDPTDPDANNPWNNCSPAINASDITIQAGNNYNIRNNVTATDTCGNDITSTITVNGSYDIHTVGSYPITFSVTDLLGRSASITITLTVTPSSSDTKTETPKPTEKQTEKQTTEKQTEKETTEKKTEKETSKKETNTKPSETSTDPTTKPQETTPETTSNQETESDNLNSENAS